MERDPPQHVGRKDAAARKAPAASTNQTHGKFPVAPRQAAAPFYHAMAARGLSETRTPGSVQCAVAVDEPALPFDEPGKDGLGNFFRGGCDFLPTRHAANDDLRGEIGAAARQAAGR
jgi:hypothetical protein